MNSFQIVFTLHVCYDMYTVIIYHSRSQASHFGQIGHLSDILECRRPIQNLIEIRSVGYEIKHAGGRTDR
jgi:hypothetical protein